MKQQHPGVSFFRSPYFFSIFAGFLFLICFPMPAGFAQTDEKNFISNLTAEEREWMLLHPEIKIGIMDAWPPLNYVNENGKSEGMGVGYLSVLNSRIGGRLVPVPGPFKKNYDLVLNGKLDALMDITSRPDREKLFCFTRPYIVVPHVIVGRKGGNYFKSEQDLFGKTLALEQGFHNINYFKEKYPSVVIREYENTKEALDAVSHGEADAYAGNRAVVIHLIEKEFINNLLIMGKLKDPSSILQIGVKKDNALLTSILDKALASITEEEELLIRQKFLQESVQILNLTDAEYAWLRKHSDIKVAFKSTWAPIEFVDEHGIPQGISADYLHEIEEILKINFNILKRENWEQMYQDIKSHKLDLICSMIKTEEYESDLNFTDAYLSFPIGVFNRLNAPYITSIQDLNGNKIAVINDHPTERILKKKHPDLHLVPEFNIISALKKLSTGEVDFIAGNTITYGYYLTQCRIDNIKLAGETPYRYELVIGIRKDWPEFLPILNKAFKAISESERHNIYYKWTQPQQRQNINYVLIWEILGGALGVVVLFFLWNRRLGREIKIRKHAEAELQVSQRELVNMVRDLNLKKEELESANNKLKDLDKLKSMFIASMSHELRTPLNSIIGFTGIILQGMTGEINNEQREQLQRVLKAGKHLLSLITDVIDISKIEAGKIEAYVEEFSLSSVLNEALINLKLPIKEKNLEIEVRTIPEKIILRTDKKRFFQCILNYLSNAVKYSEKGKITVFAEEKGNKIYFSVTDTGIGIKEEDLPNLFQSFVRLNSNLKMTVAGTGLGLYLTKKLVTELLGGEVSVTSVLGKGSTFSLIIPKHLSKPQDLPHL